jgi:prevent-host-death family protein
MTARISATDAKNNFGGLLELVTARGRVEITKHGRVVAVVMSPRLADSHGHTAGHPGAAERPGAHMIPPGRARAARLVRAPQGFDDP